MAVVGVWRHRAPFKSPPLVLLVLLLWIRVSDGFTARSMRTRRSNALEMVLDLTPEDEAIIRQIRGDAEPPQRGPRTIVIFSDTTGVTAKSAVSKSIAQFNGCDERYIVLDEGASDTEDTVEDDLECINLSTKVFPFIQDEASVADVLKKCVGKSVLVVYTFASPELRAQTARMCELSQLPHVDLLGPMFNSMSDFFDRKPLGPASDMRSYKRRVLSDDYYKRIEAVEYTLKCDDGMKPRLWKEADVILLGVSRTGKTPLSVVLAQTMALKVANLPLVVDLQPSRRLFEPDIDPRRVFCLTLDPSDLQRIRRYRLSRELEHAAKDQFSSYADPSYLAKDLANARRIALENGFTEIDVTGRAVEETASYIRGILNSRFPHLY